MKPGSQPASRRPAAPCLLSIGDATVARIRGERELVADRQSPPALFVRPCGSSGDRLARHPRCHGDLFPDAYAVQGLSLRTGRHGEKADMGSAPDAMLGVKNLMVAPGKGADKLPLTGYLSTGPEH